MICFGLSTYPLNFCMSLSRTDACVCISFFALRKSTGLKFGNDKQILMCFLIRLLLNCSLFAV